MGKSNSEFWEAYRDPRWQKKRLEVMEAAHWKCERCGVEDKTLNVHHRFYRKGHSPWEYDNKSLMCLCEHCHEIHHALMQHLKELLGALHSDSLIQVVGYVAGLVLQRNALNGDFGAKFKLPEGEGEEQASWCIGLAHSYIDRLNTAMAIQERSATGIGHDEICELERAARTEEG